MLTFQFYNLQMDSGKRGEASERQKTVEEIAHEEREKLVRQEKARLAGMDQVFCYFRELF